MRSLITTTLVASLAVLGAAQATAQSTYKVAYIDMLSGPFANVGEIMLTHIQ
ncbi:MAG: branched-chain amino acid ABC transporter substrate-binding protein, partial [Comamonadaceae bacterium]